jgi:hypothetical protein
MVVRVVVAVVVSVIVIDNAGSHVGVLVIT